jgi:hypothetical protein
MDGLVALPRAVASMGLPAIARSSCLNHAAGRAARDRRMLLRLFFAVDLPWIPPAARDAYAISKCHLRLQANARRRHLQLCQPVCVRDSACIPIYVPMPTPMPMPMLMWMYHGARACAMQLRDAKGRAGASKGEIWRSRSARVGRSVRLGYPRPVRHASFRLRRQPEHAAALAQAA